MMTNNPILNTDHASILSMAMSKVQGLQTNFNTPFEIWQFNNGWTKLLNSPIPQHDVTRVYVEAELQNLNVNQGPLIRRISPFETFLAIPIIVDQNSSFVAVGFSPLSEPQIFASFVNSTISSDTNTQSDSNEIQQELVDQYADQASADMEEKMWMRHATHFLGLNSHADSTEASKEELLQSLRRIIQSESLIYVREKRAISRWNRSRNQQDQIIQVFGKPVLKQQIHLLVEEYEKQSWTYPEYGTGEDSHVLSTDSTIVVEVKNQSRRHGWLIAINPMNSNYRDDLSNHSNKKRRATGFGVSEISMMKSAGSVLGAHAHNFDLLQQKESVNIGVLRSMINAVDAKDSYTCGHSDRVAIIAQELSREFGYSETEAEKVYVAGLLHDVGKIGVPDEILRKPGKLTVEEFDQIKLHPQRGYDILKHLHELEHALPGVLHHHESIDGTGYPHGLGGEDIPEVARILSVADAYDAMTSDRPYRAGMPTEKAEQILREGAGKQWDSNVVVAFFDCIPLIREICMQPKRIRTAEYDENSIFYNDSEPAERTESLLNSVIAVAQY